MKTITLDQMAKQLKSMAKKAKKLNGSEQHVDFSVLFNKSFMQKNTGFSSIQEMFKNSGFSIESQSDFDSIPEAEWNSFVQSNTKFKSWEKMLHEAVAAHTAKQLGF